MRQCAVAALQQGAHESRFANTVAAATTSGACGPLANGVPYADGGHNLQFPGGSCGAAIDSRWPFLGA